MEEHSRSADFAERLRRVEGQLGEQEPRVRIERYDEGGGKQSWKDWILGLVALLIVAWLGKISLQMDKLTEVVVKQSQDEQRLDRIESHVFRGNP